MCTSVLGFVLAYLGVLSRQPWVMSLIIVDVLEYIALANGAKVFEGEPFVHAEGVEHVEAR